MQKLERGDGIVLKRDVHVTLIPEGKSIVLPSGIMVRIIQALGGAYTIEYNSQWLMVYGEDADALGVAPMVLDMPEDGDIESQVWALLKTCYDPEIPVNIVDLGLIYGIGVTEEKELYAINVVMTLTAAGCGMGPVIVREVERKVGGLPKVTHTTVELVFDPPWNQTRMTEEAQLALGLL